MPGCIDYFLLYLVKINKLSKNLEKKIYVYLTTWIRSPGICYVCIMSIYGFPYIYEKSIQNNNIYIFLACLTSTVLTFWNGQYYMYITVRDSVKKKIV